MTISSPRLLGAFSAFDILPGKTPPGSEPRESQLLMNPQVGGVANVDVIAKLRLIEETLARARRLTSAYRRLVELANTRGLSISPRPGHVDPAVPRRAYMLTHLQLNLDATALLRDGFTARDIAACEDWLLEPAPGPAAIFDL